MASGIKTKKKSSWILIKVVHSSIFSSLFCGSSSHYDDGDVIRAIHISQEKIDKYNKTPKGKEDPYTANPYYLTSDGERIAEGLATIEISSKDLNKAIRKLEKEQQKHLDEKALRDRCLKSIGANLVHLYKDRKNKQNV